MLWLIVKQWFLTPQSGLFHVNFLWKLSWKHTLQNISSKISYFPLYKSTVLLKCSYSFWWWTIFNLDSLRIAYLKLSGTIIRESITGRIYGALCDASHCADLVAISSRHLGYVFLGVTIEINLCKRNRYNILDVCFIYEYSIIYIQ